MQLVFRRLALPAGGLSVVGLAMLGAMWITGFMARFSAVVLVSGLVVGVGAVILANWRIGVYLFLGWLIIEDLPRKFMGNDMRLFATKDVLAVILYMAFLVAWFRSGERGPKARFLIPLLAFLSLCLVQVFNPESPILVYGLLGLRMYFFYIPLIFVGYALLRSENDLRRFLNFNIVAGVMIGALGIMQGILGLDFLNPTIIAPELHLARLVREAPISGLAVPRPSSVFVSDSRFAWYMMSVLLLGQGAIGYRLACGTRAWWGIGAAGVMVSAIFLSGVRGTLLLALGSVVVVPVVLILESTSRTGLRIRHLLPLGLIPVGVVALGALLFVVYPEATGARWSFYYETIAPWSPTSELAWRTWGYPVGELTKAFVVPGWVVGNGLGTSSLGVQYVVELLNFPPPRVGVESGYGTLIIELGLLGLALWLLWTVRLVREGWTVVRYLRGTTLFPIGFAILWFTILLLFPLTMTGIGPYQNYLFNAYFWLLIGILFRLPGLLGPRSLRGGVAMKSMVGAVGP